MLILSPKYNIQYFQLMIRQVEPTDAKAIADIYNEFVTHSVATFEIEPISEDAMRKRIADISSCFPYFVYETNKQVAGFCYAHTWKERAAYRHTLETTIYISPLWQGQGIGRQLMTRLIKTCRQAGYLALIACITDSNESSKRLHATLGFKKVSHFEKVGMKFNLLLDVSDYELLLATDKN